MSGYDVLNDFIAGVERLGEMNRLVAEEAEKVVLAAARATAAAGQSPSGDAWAERKEGGKALKGAAEALSSSVDGNRVEIRLGPPWVFHNYGAGGSSTTRDAVRARERGAAKRAKGGGPASKFHAPKRQILPIKGEPIPSAIGEAIAKAAKRVFARETGGR